MTRWWTSSAQQASAEAGRTPGIDAGRVTFVPHGGLPDFTEPVDFADWLAHARVMNADDLEPVEPDASELETR
jgi:hypothetical protein